MQDEPSTIEKLFEVIKNEILHKFILSANEIIKKSNRQNIENIEDLFSKALRKLSKHTAHGELGELILFTLLEVYYEAPKLLSKISLKTSRRMPVFGADAIHGQYKEDIFVLYMGESKLRKEFYPAAKEAVNSIKSVSERYQDEFDLLDSHLDFPDITSEVEEQLLDLLNPLKPSPEYLQIHYPCFIGFSHPEITYDYGNQNSFIDSYIESSHDKISAFFSEIELNGIDINHTYLLLLPFESIENLVARFIDYMGIEK
tara:strand:- start:1832 stop:2605 length:774 start_codon:yes stop_codon:yes gene_type:complete